jgi:hypothetical protein
MLLLPVAACEEAKRCQAAQAMPTPVLVLAVVLQVEVV